MRLITPFMEQLHEELIEKRNVSASTASLYLKNLTMLNGGVPFTNLAFLKTKESVDAKLAEYAESTRKSIVGGVVSVLSLKKDTAAYKAIHRWYADKLDVLNTAGKEADSTKKTEKQEKNWMSWKAIQDVKNELDQKVTELRTKKQITHADFNTLLNAVILSLYTDVPPRRNQDYQEMFVTKKWTDKHAKDCNWLDLGGKQFVFNVYKTAKTHGQQTMEIPPALYDTVYVFLRNHPGNGTKDFRFLTTEDGTPMMAKNAITRILNRIFGKSVGSTMLRHIYLSDKYDIKGMTEDAELMGHSLDLQRQYMKE